jgi:hypothetical protein
VTKEGLPSSVLFGLSTVGAVALVFGSTGLRRIHEGSSPASCFGVVEGEVVMIRPFNIGAFDKLSLAAFPRSKAQPRVVWIIFDESEGLSFAQRPTGLRLPGFGACFRRLIAPPGIFMRWLLVAIRNASRALARSV